MVILKYQLTEEEFFQFNYYTNWSAPEKRGYRVRYVLKVVILYLIIAAIYLLTLSENRSLMALAVFTVPAIIYFLLIPTLVKRGMRQRVRAMLAKPENKQFLEPSEVMIMDTGIITKDELSEGKFSWDAIIRKAETPSCFYLYTNTFLAIVIPKRVLVNNQEYRELQRLLNQHLPLSSEFPER